jgi:serine/threonine protein kinase
MLKSAQHYFRIQHSTLSLAPGARLGPYEIDAPLGKGGIREVYRARDTRLGRAVAIKVLSANLAHDPQFRDRFDREARRSRNSRIRISAPCMTSATPRAHRFS